MFKFIKHTVIGFGELVITLIAIYIMIVFISALLYPNIIQFQERLKLK